MERLKDGVGPQRSTGSFDPFALVDGNEYALDWDQPTAIEVASEEPHELRVFIRILGLHWCGAEMHFEPLMDGGNDAVKYHLEVRDRWMNRGNLERL